MCIYMQLRNIQSKSWVGIKDNPKSTGICMKCSNPQPVKQWCYCINTINMSGHNRNKIITGFGMAILAQYSSFLYLSWLLFYGFMSLFKGHYYTCTCVVVYINHTTYYYSRTRPTRGCWAPMSPWGLSVRDIYISGLLEVILWGLDSAHPGPPPTNEQIQVLLMDIRWPSPCLLESPLCSWDCAGRCSKLSGNGMAWCDILNELD